MARPHRISETTRHTAAAEVVRRQAGAGNVKLSAAPHRPFAQPTLEQQKNLYDGLRKELRSYCRDYHVYGWQDGVETPTAKLMEVCIGRTIDKMRKIETLLEEANHA